MGKIAEKGLYECIFDIMARISSAELTKTHSFRLFN